MHYIGMDTHISTLDFAVVNDRGELKKMHKTSTSAKALIDFLQTIPKPRKLFIEEGSLASWIVETCHTFGENVFVTDPKQNKWIGSADEKSDPIDARKIAELARGGYVKEIPHAVGMRREFRELVLAYHDLIRQQIRIKNKIKDRIQRHGIRCTGKTVYLEKYRSSWLEKLPIDSTSSFMLKRLWELLDRLEDSVTLIKKQIKKFDKHFPEIKAFQKITGIGPIHSATLSGIIENPHRFANKSKIWKYAGLAKVRKGSGGKIYSEKLSKNYNRILKYTVKQAVQAAIKAKKNPIRDHYLNLTLGKKMPSHLAQITTCRKLITIIWTIWKKGEAYNPKLAYIKKPA